MELSYLINHMKNFLMLLDIYWQYYPPPRVQRARKHYFQHLSCSKSLKQLSHNSKTQQTFRFWSITKHPINERQTGRYVIKRCEARQIKKSNSKMSLAKACLRLESQSSLQPKPYFTRANAAEINLPRHVSMTCSERHAIR